MWGEGTIKSLTTTSVAGLFALWFLFGGWGYHRVDCGIYVPDVQPIYAPKEVSSEIHKITTEAVFEDGRLVIKYGPASTTVILAPGETFEVRATSKIVGYKPYPDAIEHNKRVEACKTENGQF